MNPQPNAPSSLNAYTGRVKLRDTVVRQRQIDGIRAAWNKGESADARHALDQFPALNARRSCILEVAYEEYCCRTDNGEDIRKTHFCERFPEVRRSLARQIDVHEYLQGMPNLLPGVVSPHPADTIVFGRFRIVEQLGRGALARAYLCYELGVGNRLVVLKIAKGGSHEADMLGRLEHANIMPIFSLHVDEASGQTAICMPFRGEHSLAAIIDAVWRHDEPPRDAKTFFNAAQVSEPLNSMIPNHEPTSHATFVGQAAQLAMELAGALAHSHAQGIRHEDVKPSNVLITPQGRALLMDFNLSSTHHYNFALTGGTLPYMSPEQLQANLLHSPPDSTLIDNQTDVFSLGVLIYEFLTGRLPFGEPATEFPCKAMVRELLHRQSQGPTPIHHHNPDVPIAMSDLVHSCLAYSADDRPSDLQHLAKQFEQWTDASSGNAVAAHPIRRHRRLIACAAMALIAILVVSNRWQGNGITAEPTEGAVVITDDTLETAFERGVFHLRNKQWESAVQNFEAHCENQPDGAAFAALHYAYHRLNQFRRAIHYRDLALAEGFESAGFLNNVAATMDFSNQTEEFRQFADQALQLKADLPAAQFNRAMSDLRFYRCDRANYEPLQGANDLLELRRRFPHNGLIAKHCTVLCAVLAQHDPSYIEPALDAAEVAYQRGFGSLLNPQNDDLKAIAKLHRFARLSQIAPQAVMRDSFDRLAFPLDDIDTRLAIKRD